MMFKSNDLVPLIFFLFWSVGSKRRINKSTGKFTVLLGVQCAENIGILISICEVGEDFPKNPRKSFFKFFTN